MKYKIQSRKQENWFSNELVTETVRTVTVQGVTMSIPESIASQPLQIQWAHQHGGNIKPAGVTNGYLVLAGQARDMTDIGINKYQGDFCHIDGEYLVIEK